MTKLIKPNVEVVLPEPRSLLGFQVKHDGPPNQLIATEIKICKAYDPVDGPSDVPFETTNAIWDTGANHSVIRKSLADKLKLIPNGFVASQSFKQKKHRRVQSYLANITVPGGVMFSQVVVSEMQSEMTFPHLSFGVLIGMDIIGQGDFQICRRNGETYVKFGIPVYDSPNGNGKALTAASLGMGHDPLCIQTYSLHNVTNEVKVCASITVAVIGSPSVSPSSSISPSVSPSASQSPSSSASLSLSPSASISPSASVSPSTPGGALDVRLLEDGDARLLEDGDFRLVE